MAYVPGALLRAMPLLYVITILFKSSLDCGLLLRGSDGAVSGFSHSLGTLPLLSSAGSPLLFGLGELRTVAIHGQGTNQMRKNYPSLAHHLHS